MSTPTRPALLAITATGPVRVRELYQREGFGIVWEVMPENFESLIDMINAHGGPDFWEITEL